MHSLGSVRRRPGGEVGCVKAVVACCLVLSSGICQGVKVLDDLCITKNANTTCSTIMMKYMACTFVLLHCLHLVSVKEWKCSMFCASPRTLTQLTLPSRKLKYLVYAFVMLSCSAC